MHIRENWRLRTLAQGGGKLSINLACFKLRFPSGYLPDTSSISQRHESHFPHHVQDA